MHRFGPSRRLEQVQQPVIPLVAQWSRQVCGTLSLAQGVVSYDPPTAIADAIASVDPADADICRYGPAEGFEPLLQLIEAKLAADNSISLDGQSVVCTAGSNMAFLAAVLSVASVGDEILLVRPYYFNHQMAIQMVGCKCRYADCLPNYQLDVEAIRNAISPRTKAVVTVSPNNPTGAVYSQASLKELNQLCEQNGVFHIHDEAYEYFTFGEESHFSPGSLPGADRHTISLFSLSKAYAMAGWRFGYAVLPDALLAAVTKVQDTNLISVPGITQRAASAALQEGKAWCQPKINRLDVARKKTLEVLSDTGCVVSQPAGAFYVLAKLPGGLDDVKVCKFLIEQYRVAVLPGSTFGIEEGCSLRVSFGGLAIEQLGEALTRLQSGIKSAIGNVDSLK